MRPIHDSDPFHGGQARTDIAPGGLSGSVLEGLYSVRHVDLGQVSTCECHIVESTEMNVEKPMGFKLFIDQTTKCRDT